MMKNEDTFTSQVYQILQQENPMKFIILGPGRDSVFSVSWSPPGGPLWPLNSGPFACLYGVGHRSQDRESGLSLSKYKNSTVEIQTRPFGLARYHDFVFSSTSTNINISTSPAFAGPIFLGPWIFASSYFQKNSII